MTITDTDVAEYLKSLGTMGDEVAASLENMSIKGIKMESTMCPLANVLNSRFGMISSVGPYNITLYSPYEQEDLIVQTPHYVAEFIRDFDKGKYPELDKFTYDKSN